MAMNTARRWNLQTHNGVNLLDVPPPFNLLPISALANACMLDIGGGSTVFALGSFVTNPDGVVFGFRRADEPYSASQTGVDLGGLIRPWVREEGFVIMPFGFAMCSPATNVVLLALMGLPFGPNDPNPGSDNNAILRSVNGCSDWTQSITPHAYRWGPTQGSETPFWIVNSTTISLNAASGGDGLQPKGNFWLNPNGDINASSIYTTDQGQNWGEGTPFGLNGPKDFLRTAPGDGAATRPAMVGAKA